MRTWSLAILLSGCAFGGLPLSAQPVVWSAPGALLEVSVSVLGGAAPLYPARDGSRRYYLEAREGQAYEVALANRSRERLGVVLSVDGLNAVSGERDRSAIRPGDPGRMYVLEPWESTSVRGWRTSLEGVHRFTFVDERSSYAARSGKANARMGWIEVAVFREQRPHVWRRPETISPPYPPPPYAPEREGRLEDRADAGKRERDAAGSAPSDAKARDEARGEAQADAAPPAMLPPAALEAPRRGDDSNEARRQAPESRSYPGTGWGRHEWDRAVVVDFRPYPEPSERITLRYEYRPALQALGLLPRWPADRDRLAERERGRGGFVTPPSR